MIIKKITVGGQIELEGGSISKITFIHTGTATLDLFDGTGTTGKPIASLITLANIMTDVDFSPKLPFKKLFVVLSAGTVFFYY